jgi:hypothetical protein
MTRVLVTILGGITIAFIVVLSVISAGAWLCQLPFLGVIALCKDLAVRSSRWAQRRLEDAVDDYFPRAIDLGEDPGNPRKWY